MFPNRNFFSVLFPYLLFLVVSDITPKDATIIEENTAIDNDNQEELYQNPASSEKMETPFIQYAKGKTIQPVLPKVSVLQFLNNTSSESYGYLLESISDLIIKNVKEKFDYTVISGKKAKSILSQARENNSRQQRQISLEILKSLATEEKLDFIVYGEFNRQVTKEQKRKHNIRIICKVYFYYTDESLLLMDTRVPVNSNLLNILEKIAQRSVQTMYKQINIVREKFFIEAQKRLIAEKNKKSEYDIDAKTSIKEIKEVKEIKLDELAKAPEIKKTKRKKQTIVALEFRDIMYEIGFNPFYQTIIGAKSGRINPLGGGFVSFFRLSLQTMIQEIFKINANMPTWLSTSLYFDLGFASAYSSETARMTNEFFQNYI